MLGKLPREFAKSAGFSAVGMATVLARSEKGEANRGTTREGFPVRDW